MDMQNDQEDARPEPETEATQRAADRLQATLLAPLPTTPTLPAPSSPLSEETASLALLQTVVMRTDQVAQASQEQWARVEAVLQQMVATMQLAQVMIAQQDRQQTQLTALMDRLEQAAAALIKVNSNLSEIIAALLQSDQGG